MGRKSRLNQLNQEINSCEKCDLHSSRQNILTGEGYPNSRLFFIPQAPGEKEDKQNKMFVGPSGEIFRELIKNANLDWDDFYISNLIKCKLPNNRAPKQVEINTCSIYLDQEIEIVDPDILVPLGYYSTKYIFNKYGIVEDLARDKFPDYTAKFQKNENKKIFPLAHPATLLYKPELESVIKKNYQKLESFTSECKWFSLCPMRRFTEEGQLDEKWVEFYCKGNWKSCKRYQMEEKGRYHPDNMLPDGSIDESLD